MFKFALTTILAVVFLIVWTVTIVSVGWFLGAVAGYCFPWIGIALSNLVHVDTAGQAGAVIAFISALFWGGRTERKKA